MIIKSKNYQGAKEFLKSEHINQLKKTCVKLNIEFYGPLYIGKQDFIHEWRFLIKVKRNQKLYLIMRDLIKNMPKVKQVTIEYEIDPYTFV